MRGGGGWGGGGVGGMMGGGMKGLSADGSRAANTDNLSDEGITGSAYDHKVVTRVMS